MVYIKVVRTVAILLDPPLNDKSNRTPLLPQKSRGDFFMGRGVKRMVGSRNDPKRITKCQYKRYLDDLGFPEGEGPKRTATKRNQSYGQWLVWSDMEKFDEGYLVWEAGERIKRGLG